MSESLPLGTWIAVRGVRRFVPADPDWRPVAGIEDRTVSELFAKLAVDPHAVQPPKPRAAKHLCDDCGCLLFGVENCPQCRWLAVSPIRQREAA